MDRQISIFREEVGMKNTGWQSAIMSAFWRKMSAGLAAFVVFALMTAHAQNNNKITLYSFTGVNGDGIGPVSALILDANGNLYGTTQFGGTSTNCVGGCGTVFEVSSSGTETVLHSFTGPSTGDGANPVSGLVMDASGNLYGTTVNGGSSANCLATSTNPGGCGTVFKIDIHGNESVLYSFAGGITDGANPTNGSMIIDSANNLYGVALNGGSSTNCPSGCGVLFKISSSGIETILHTFTNVYQVTSAGTVLDGGNPSGTLLMDSAGNLYGTTQVGGGPFGAGTLYKLDPSNNETGLLAFGALSSLPAVPTSGVIMDASGNLYGTTMNGGTANDGTIFEVGTSDTITSIVPLALSSTNAGLPFAGLVTDHRGNFYGTASQGSTGSCTIPTGTLVGCGAIFVVSKSGGEKLFHDFAGPDGANPFGALIMDSKGYAYGTTMQGGASVGSAACPSGCGTVFKIHL